MGVFPALGRALKSTFQLWFAIGCVLVANAFLNAVVTLALPFEVVEGQVRVPPVTSLQQALGLAGPVGGLFMLSSGMALYLLGGIIGSLEELASSEEASLGHLFREGRRHFFPMVGWASSFFLLVGGTALAVGLGGGLLWGILGRPQLLKSLVGLLVAGSFFLGWIAFLYSPVALVHGGGVWESFKSSLRFFRRHIFATFLLLGLVVGVGVLMSAAGIVFAGVANGVRTLLGIPPYARGAPVFFLALIQGFPQAFLTVFFPGMLFAYYRGNESA
ncbi:MAG: hypothetical protein HYZ90_06410 [Candidatus Omnitrophica bacterium]|nr:hypothetical protein [Candidatus Omnitrophota bacterium]